MMETFLWMSANSAKVSTNKSRNLYECSNNIMHSKFTYYLSVTINANNNYKSAYCQKWHVKSLLDPEKCEWEFGTTESEV